MVVVLLVWTNHSNARKHKCMYCVYMHVAATHLVPCMQAHTCTERCPPIALARQLRTERRGQQLHQHDGAHVRQRRACGVALALDDGVGHAVEGLG